MARIYISIGSNIQPQRYIKTGLAELRAHFGKLLLSSTYLTEAIGFKGDNFYNLVAGFDSNEEIYHIIHTLRAIEKNNDRQRTNNRFSARTLDIDLLLYDDLILENEDIKIPRDEIIKYAFVLLPLAEIAPTLKHPITGKSYAELWQTFDKKGQILKKIHLNDQVFKD